MHKNNSKGDNMKINFLENGIDSFQKGFKSLKEYELNLVDEKSEEIERYFLLKDAVIFIHHGIEILMKHILINESIYLVFSNIDNNVKNAYIELKNKKLDNIFETSLRNKIHTVSYEEAFDRVQKICGYEFSKEFSVHILKLNEFRNQITHSSISVKELEVRQLFENFLSEVDFFFFKTIGREYKTLSNYSDLVENYESYLNLLEENGLIMKKKAIECFYDIFTKYGFGMGLSEVKRLTDIDLVSKILKDLNDSEFKFGTDFYNGHCSGDVSSIKRYDQNRLSFFTKDNNTEYIFEFRSMIIYMPELESSFSPILIFESNDNQNVEEDVKIVSKKDFRGKSISEGIFFENDQKLTFDSRELNDFYCSWENDDFFVVPQHHSVLRFLEKSIICHINIQGLSYGNFSQIIDKKYNLDGEKLEVLLRKSFK